MSAEPRAALNALISAFERHLEACASKHGEDDPTVVAASDDLADAFEAYDDALEVSVLGCAVNGIGEARHADFGITGAKDAGLIYSKGEPIKKVATEDLVDELFVEIDKYYAQGKKVVRDAAAIAKLKSQLNGTATRTR